MSSSWSQSVPEPPARIRWALDLLELERSHRVLEIGCGNGLAAQLICQRLGAAGAYLGVDRSGLAIAAARKRCASLERARFEHAAFGAAGHKLRAFSRILAVNVNLFWTGDSAGAAAAHALMRRGGRFVQVYDPPNVAQRDKIERLVQERLAPAFRFVTAKRRTLGGAAMLAIIAADAVKRSG